MSPTHVTLKVTVEGAPGGPLLLDNVSLDETVAAVIRKVVEKLSLAGGEAAWCLEYQGLPLPGNLPLRACLGAYAGVIDVTLKPGRSPVAVSRPPAAAPVPAPPATEEDFSVATDDEGGSEAVALEGSDLEGEGDSEMAGPMLRGITRDDEDEADEAAPRRTATKKRAPAKRNATVRHYSQMSPERVYPLLVVFSRGMVEKVAKKGVAQKASGPMEVDLEEPVEVEPVLPGCQCYPPKIVTRLGDGDTTLTFRVVPQVLGKIDGAAVVVRQDHATLAEIELEMKVVQRTWVVLSGAMTFLLPGLSAVMKHFGLDFETQSGQGFSLYVSAARLLFDKVDPLLLTGALGALTGLLWWVTRPKARDVFYEIKTVSPEGMLAEVREAAEDDPAGASQRLLELLKAFPDYQPGRLFYAGWHYEQENYRAALKGYKKALRLGRAPAEHYLKASLSASRMGQNQEALEILQQADGLLGIGEMTPAMVYNMACYHARLGEHGEAVACLRRAVAAGFRKKDTLQSDPDLAPLRAREDFKQLAASLV